MADIPDRRLSPLAGELRWLALVWLLVGAALACVLWLDRGRVESSEKVLLAQQARILSRALARQIATVNGALEVLADAPAHTREEAATGQGWLARQVRSQSRLHGGAQAVLDAQGRVLVASDASLAGSTHAGESFFQQIERAPSARTLYLGPPTPRVWRAVRSCSRAPSSGPMGGSLAWSARCWTWAGCSARLTRCAWRPMRWHGCSTGKRPC